MVTAHERQVFHLVFGEAEMDEESPEPCHRADRDCHFPSTPQVPLLEEHMGYLVAARLHDQPLSLPHITVGRTDGQVAAYVYLVVWDEVDSDFPRGLREYRGQLEPARGGVLMPGGVEVRDELGVLGASERLELR